MSADLPDEPLPRHGASSEVLQSSTARTRPPAIPDHELIRRIGGGSYGEVWLARNVIGTHHAVKVIYRNAFDNDRPFQREFEGIQKAMPISRSISGLVHILQAGRNDQAGYFYYVMELADAAEPRGTSSQCSVLSDSGISQSDEKSRAACTDALNTELLISDYSPRTLQSELKQRGVLPVGECIRIALTLTSALHALHEKGLVHRDIKPSNIIFVRGVPKLADIGLMASAAEAQSFVGTAGFIPPEGPGTPQADLYGLGKVLYEISTGKDRQDFPELPVRLIQENANKTQNGQRQWNLQKAEDGSPALGRAGEAEGGPFPGTLLELNSILLKACETDFRQRYQTAQQMHDELRLLQAGHSIKRKRSAERRLALAQRSSAVAAVLGLVAAGGWLLSTRLHRSTVQLFNAVEVNSIAVLPFVNQSTWPPHEYLCDTLTEEAIHGLTSCARLRVAPRAAILAFRSTTNDLGRVGQQLGVRVVLAGTFLRDSNGMHVTARLFNVADGRPAWTTTLDQPRDGFDALAAELVRQTARQLKVSVEDVVFRRSQTNAARTLAAYRLFNRAHQNPWNTQPGLTRAIELLHAILVENPSCARAHADLANCYFQGSGFHWPPRQAQTAAKSHALRALALDESLPTAHLVLGYSLYSHDLDFAKAEASFQRGIAFAPRNADSYATYAHALCFLGRFAEAEKLLHQAEQADPRHHNALGGWGWRYYLARDFEKTIQATRRLLAVHTNSSVGLMFLGWAQERLGRCDEALKTAERMLQLDPAQDFVAFHGRVHACLGHREEAQKALSELGVMSRSGRNPALFSAQVLLALGENAHALNELERASVDYPPVALMLKADPVWDDLRTEPRFQALLAKVGLDK